MQFLSKSCINKFHRSQGLFWIKRSSRKEKFLDLELTQKKFMDSEWDLISNKGDLLVEKWMCNNYRRSSALLLDQNMTIVAKLQGTCEELTKNSEERRGTVEP